MSTIFQPFNFDPKSSTRYGEGQAITLGSDEYAFVSAHCSGGGSISVNGSAYLDSNAGGTFTTYTTFDYDGVDTKLDSGESYTVPTDGIFEGRVSFDTDLSIPALGTVSIYHLITIDDDPIAYAKFDYVNQVTYSTCEFTGFYGVGNGNGIRKVSSFQYTNFNEMIKMGPEHVLAFGDPVTSSGTSAPTYDYANMYVIGIVKQWEAVIHTFPETHATSSFWLEASDSVTTSTGTGWASMVVTRFNKL